MLDKIVHLLLRPSLIHLLSLSYLSSLDQGQSKWLNERKAKKSNTEMYQKIRCIRMIAFMEKVTSALHRSSAVETVGEVGGGGNGSWLHTTMVLPLS